MHFGLGLLYNSEGLKLETIGLVLPHFSLCPPFCFFKALMLYVLLLFSWGGVGNFSGIFACFKPCYKIVEIPSSLSVGRVGRDGGWSGEELSSCNYNTGYRRIQGASWAEGGCVRGTVMLEFRQSAECCNGPGIISLFIFKVS